MAKATASRQQLSGADILGFLRTFEGAAATFSQGSGHWSLWLPEFSPDGHPLTPASQIFFPVILRRDDQAFAIRFFYDCASGKVRYYTSAIPEDIARLPALENAISELFRHSLPVEAIRQRSLGKDGRGPAAGPPLEPRPVHRQSLADPDDRSIPAGLYAKPAMARPALPPPAREPVAEMLPPEEAPLVFVPVAPVAPKSEIVIKSPGEERASSPAEKKITLPTARPVTTIVPKPVPSPEAIAASPRALVEFSSPPRPREVTRTVKVELGPRTHSVLLAMVVTLGLVLLLAIGGYIYLQATQDPGVQHHRLQIEEMRMRNGG